MTITVRQGRCKWLSGCEGKVNLRPFIRASAGLPLERERKTAHRRDPDRLATGSWAATLDALDCLADCARHASPSSPR